MKHIESNVFVYGSLKRGFALHYLVAGQTFLGTAITKPLYHLFDCGRYPGIVKATNNSVAINGVAINGELYCVDSQCLQQLHEVEGVDEGLYRYEIIELQAPFSKLQCRSYFYLLSTDKLSNCGCE